MFCGELYKAKKCIYAQCSGTSKVEQQNTAFCIFSRTLLETKQVEEDNYGHCKHKRFSSTWGFFFSLVVVPRVVSMKLFQNEFNFK